MADPYTITVKQPYKVYFASTGFEHQTKENLNGGNLVH
jgi:hypothetical protein